MRPTLSSEPLLPHPVCDRCGGAKSLTLLREGSVLLEERVEERAAAVAAWASFAARMSLRRPGPRTTRSGFLHVTGRVWSQGKNQHL